MSNGNPTNPDQHIPPAPVTITQNAGADGNMGMGASLLARVWNSTAMGIIAAVFVVQMFWQRSDHQADRMAFVQAVKDMNLALATAVKDLNSESNRHTGEIKGAMDKNTEVMRDLKNVIEFSNRRPPAPGSAAPKDVLEKMATELKPIPQKPPS
jgi:hypothetical protein